MIRLNMLNLKSSFFKNKLKVKFVENFGGKKKKIKTNL